MLQSILTQVRKNIHMYSMLFIMCKIYTGNVNEDNLNPNLMSNFYINRLYQSISLGPKSDSSFSLATDL